MTKTYHLSFRAQKELYKRTDQWCGHSDFSLHFLKWCLISICFKNLIRSLMHPSLWYSTLYWLLNHLSLTHFGFSRGLIGARATVRWALWNFINLLEKCVMSNFEKQRFTAMMKYPFDLCFSISSNVFLISCLFLPPQPKALWRLSAILH